MGLLRQRSSGYRGHDAIEELCQSLLGTIALEVCGIIFSSTHHYIVGLKSRGPPLVLHLE
jgi:hypothetical protein